MNPSVGLLLGGVENETGLRSLIANESGNPITAPYPLDCEFGESIDMRFVLPPQFRRTL